MASIGPNNPTAAVNAIYVGSTWVNPTECFAQLGGSTYITGLDAEEDSYGLKVTGFGFTVPDGATINGIIVEVRRSESHTTGIDASDLLAKLVKAGTDVGTDKASGTTWTFTPTYETYGGASDLWGTSWTPAEINASDFGFLFRCNASFGPSTGRKANVDHIRITVHYTLGAGDSAGQQMFAVF